MAHGLGCTESSHKSSHTSELFVQAHVFQVSFLSVLLHTTGLRPKTTTNTTTKFHSEMPSKFQTKRVREKQNFEGKLKEYFLGKCTPIVIALQYVQPKIKHLQCTFRFKRVL